MSKHKVVNNDTFVGGYDRASVVGFIANGEKIVRLINRSLRDPAAKKQTLPPRKPISKSANWFWLARTGRAG